MAVSDVEPGMARLEHSCNIATLLQTVVVCWISLFCGAEASGVENLRPTRSQRSNMEALWGARTWAGKDEEGSYGGKTSKSLQQKPKRSFDLPTRDQLPYDLDRALDRHLRHRLLSLQPLLQPTLVTLKLRMQPLERIRHVKIFLTTRTL